MEKEKNDIIKVLKMKPFWNDGDKLCTVRAVISFVFAFASFVLMFADLKSGTIQMAISSIVLVVGFIASGIVASVFKKPTLAGFLIAGLAIFVLSGYAIGGGNEGFAILWILVVPMFAISILDLVSGLLISVYFLIFLPILFYSPLNQIIEGKYTDSFSVRFPVLYACVFVIAIFLSMQKEYYSRKAHILSYVDELTGAYNRRYFLETVDREKIKNSKELSLIMIDVNGLKYANDTYGHEAGDELICAVPKCCRDVLGEDVLICRMGGDEFAIILTTGKESITNLKEEIYKRAAEWQGKHLKELHFAMGSASRAEFPEENIEALLKIADEKMYEDKKRYYDALELYKKNNDVQ